MFLWRRERVRLGGVVMRKSSVLLLVVFAFVAAACSSDASEQIEGTWFWSSPWNAYIEYADDGQFLVSGSSDFADPIEWGEYTFDGETLTLNNATDSPNCSDTSVTWTVEFSDDGDEASYTFVEDSCADYPRSRDIVWMRQSS